MAFFSLWPMWCLVCGHLVHAMRQVAENDDVNPIDNMFCECKEVYSVEECPDYGNTKFGLSSGIPRYYHEQVGKLEFEAKCKVLLLELPLTRYFLSLGIRTEWIPIFEWHMAGNKSQSCCWTMSIPCTSQLL